MTLANLDALQDELLKRGKSPDDLQSETGMMKELKIPLLGGPALHRNDVSPSGLPACPPAVLEHMLAAEVATTMAYEHADRDFDGVIITDELERRPSRPPDHEAENRALTSLAEAMGHSPTSVLQRLVEAAMQLTRADSAGISLLEPDGDQGTIRWIATAGAWAPYRDGTMPRQKSPCGEVMTREAVLLVRHPERAFPALLQAQPGISEGLIAPFLVNG